MWTWLLPLIGLAHAAPFPQPDVGHQAWTVADGLPSSGVTAILQTPDDWLWVATFDGLSRFDGQRFTDIEPREGRWPSRRLLGLQRAPDGQLWLQTEPGHVLRLDPERLVLTTFGDESRNPRGSLQVGPTGTVWVPGRDQLLRLDGDALVPFGPLADVAAPAQVVEGPAGLWLRAEGGVHHVDATGRRTSIDLATLGVGRLTHLFVEPDVAWVAGELGVVAWRGTVVTPLIVAGAPLREPVVRVDRGPDGTLLLSTERGLLPWRDGTLGPPIADDPNRPAARFQAVGPDGATWVATRTAVVRDGRVVWRFDPSVHGARDLLVDHEGSAWVATTGGGLHRLQQTRFSGLSVGDGLPSDNVYALLDARDGSLWVGSQRGSLAQVTDDGVRAFRADGLPEDVTALWEDDDGTLWVGSWDEGLWRGDAVRGFTRVEALDAHTTVRVLLRRRDGALWAGTDRGLFALDDGAWRRLDDALGLPAAPIRALLEADDGTVWAGTAGAGVLHITHHGATRWDASSPLGSDQVRALWAAPGAGVWVGTEDAGLRHVGPAGPSGHGISTADGLPGHTVHALLDDGQGWLWGSTNDGLFRIAQAALEARAAGRTASPRVEVFTERDGLRNREGNGGNGHAAARLRDGRLAFSGQRGVVLFDPHALSRGGPDAHVIVEGVEVDGVLHAVIDGRVELAPHERTFGVSYTSLSFRAPERIRFTYRLDGVDRADVDAGGRRTAWYTEVRPGTYRFQVSATNSDGRPSPDRGELTVVVRPYLSETPAARWGGALLVVLLVGGAVRWRLGVQQRRQRELEAIVVERTRDLRAETAALEASRAVVEAQASQLREIDRVKTRYFTDLSHELRTPLTLVLGPLADVRAGRHGRVPPGAVQEVERAERSARRLFGLVNQLLDVVKIDADQLRLACEVHDLREVVGRVIDELAPLADRRGVALAYTAPDEVVPVALDPRELPKVVWNLVTNAIKYAPRGGHVGVQLSRHGAHARLVVDDDGPGIPAEALDRIFDRFYMAASTDGRVQPGTGLGLSLARQLAEAHGGTVMVDQSAGVGARFVVELPVVDGVVRPLAEEVEPLLDPSLDEDPDVADGDDDRTTVLVVDDHAEVRAWIADILRRRYRVLVASDGRDALDVARAHQPDVVVTDLMMPSMDGHDLIAALRASPELDGVAIVVLTARAAADVQAESLQRGADVVLTKPFSSVVLLAQVHQLVTQRQRLRRETTADGEVTASVASDGGSADDRYVRRVVDLVVEHYADPSFGVQELAKLAHQDRAHLYRRLKALTGESPSDLIRRVRLERAARLLERRAASVSEIAYGVGFDSVSYFSTAFRRHFGVPPSAYRPEAEPPGPPTV